MLPFKWNVQNKQVYGETKKITGCLGLEGIEDRQVILCSFFWDDKNVLQLSVHISMNMLKTIEMYILSVWIIWYLNYIEIKLLKMKLFLQY